MVDNVPVTPSIWSWHTQFGPDEGMGFQVSQAQCAFAWQNDVVLCDMEGVPDETGEQQVSAVQGTCPICDTGFRLTPVVAPFSIEVRPKIFRSLRGPVKCRPLTVYIPFSCGAKVAALNDDGHVIGVGTCDWQAIIRRGVAMPIPQVQQLLPQAIEYARGEWSKAMTAIGAAEGRTGQDLAQWKATLHQVWNACTPAIQAIQTGQYARSGPTSIVGAWDTVDHVSETAQAMVRQLGG